MAGQRGQARAHEDARNLCVICGQFGWKGNPVTIRLTDSQPKHVKCRERETNANA